MAKKKISFLDKTFWITESRDNAKHVAGLQILQLPDSAGSDYLDNLYAQLRQFDQAVAPFNLKVKSLWRYPLKLVPVTRLDMGYHVQQHRINDIANKGELHTLVAKLHNIPLDRAHPLWQYHLIRDDSGKCFAIYLKIHHMYGDGTTLLKWFQAGYKTTPEIDNFSPVWAIHSKPEKTTKISLMRRIGKLCWDTLNIVKDMLSVTFRLLLKLVRLNTHYMPIPFSGSRTHLTGQVKAGRAVTTAELDFNRVKALSKRTQASINEIFLCAFDIATLRLLKDYGQAFDRPLLTNMPINLRKPGEQTLGNKIAIVPVELAHGEKNPYLRLQQIMANHRIVKNAARKARPASFSYYTILIHSFALLFEMLHLSDWIRPIANILVSNMPGPKETRYLKDSKLLACYPISAITPGGGVNITLMSYAAKVNIGMVCCNKTVASLDPLAQYFFEAFDMLEQCIDDPTLNIDNIGHSPAQLMDSLVSESALKQRQDSPVLQGAI